MGDVGRTEKSRGGEIRAVSKPTMAETSKGVKLTAVAQIPRRPIRGQPRALPGIESKSNG